MPIVKTMIATENQSMYNPVTSRSAGCTDIELNALLDLLGSEEAVITLPPINGAGVAAGWVLDDDVTVPRTVTLHIPHGTTVEVTAGNTLAINGPLMANNPNWYSGEGTVVFNYASLSSEESFSQWGSGFVVSGGLHGISASLTSPSFAYRARTNNGRDILGTGITITYDDGDGTYWVIGYQDTDGAVPSGWTRVGISHLLMQKNATRPALPAQGVWLMEVIVSGAEITEVLDLRDLFLAVGGIRHGTAAERQVLVPGRGRTFKQTNTGRGTYVGTGYGWSHLERGEIDLREWTIGNGDLTTALTEGVPEARAAGMTLAIPEGLDWFITDSIILGSHDGATSLTGVHITGPQREWFDGPHQCIITADMNKPMFKYEASGGGAAVGSRLSNFMLINNNSGTSNNVLESGTSTGIYVEHVQINSGYNGILCTGILISARFDDVTVLAANACYDALCSHVYITHGRVYGANYGFNVSGSLQVDGLNSEFCAVMCRIRGESQYIHFNGCHFENCHCLLTNAVAVPINLSGAWTDAGGVGYIVSGSVSFDGCEMGFGLTGNTNMIVVKAPSGGSFQLITMGCRIEHPFPVGTNSFTPGATTDMGTPVQVFNTSIGITYYVSDSPFDSLFDMGAQIGTGNKYLNIKRGNFDIITANMDGITGGIAISAAKFRLFSDAGDDHGMYTLSGFTEIRGGNGVKIIRTGNGNYLEFSNHLFPNTDGTADLGVAATNEWRSLHIVNTPSGSSDVRLKKDIEPEKLGLGFVLKLNSVQYRLIKDPEFLRHSLLAHEVTPLLDPDDSIVVHPENEDGYYGLRKGDLVTILVKAIQEQQAQIEALDKRISDSGIQPATENAATPRGPVRSPRAVTRGTKRVARSGKPRSC